MDKRADNIVRFTFKRYQVQVIRLKRAPAALPTQIREPTASLGGQISPKETEICIRTHLFTGLI